MSRFTRSMAGAIATTIACIALPAHAADPVAGKALYLDTHASPLSCAASSCHGTDPAQGKNNILKGKTGPAILSAINGISDMSLFRAGMPWAVTAAEADDIAAYIANPNAGAPAPAIKLSTTSLAFGSQQVLTPSAPPMVVTVSNTGSADLALQTITVGGTHATDFARAGTCAPGGIVAANGTCTIAMTFTPQATGARSATISIAHNVTGNSPSTITLAGTGAAAPTPAIGLSSPSLVFGDQLVGTTSTMKAIAVSNTGTAPLALSNVSVSGANAIDYQLSNNAGNCAAGSNLAPNATCTIDVAFSPGATGSRSASVQIASNVAGSPHAVNLTGNGTAVAVPALTLAPAAVQFGNQLIGTPSSQRAVTVTNSGGAMLNIDNIAVTGTGFAHASSCGGSLAPAANCAVNVTFTPAAPGMASGALSIASNVAGPMPTVALSGMGIESSPTPTPTPGVAGGTFKPGALSFGAQRLNSPSRRRSAILTNDSNTGIDITSLELTGPSASDFAQTSGNCPIGSVLAAKARCTVVITFTPTMAGERKAELMLRSTNAQGLPTVALQGVGVMRAGEGGTSCDDDDDEVRSTGPSVKPCRETRRSDSNRRRRR